MTNSSLSQGIAPFRAIEISHLARKLRAEGRSVIHMEFGQPSAGAPAGAVAVARAALGEPDMGYWESVPLRQRLACHYADQYGVDLEPPRTLMHCGSYHAPVLP